MVDNEGYFVGNYFADCGPDCPMHPYDPWQTDDTFKVTYQNSVEKEMMIALNLLGVMVSALILIGLLVTGLGISSLIM